VRRNESSAAMYGMRAEIEDPFTGKPIAMREFLGWTLDQIKPRHVRQFMDWRRDHEIQATREKALLSHMWNKARDWGYTDLANPCQGIKGKKAKRTVYIEDEIFQAVREVGDQPLRDAMDLAYLTGQRPADTLKFRESDIRSGALELRQNKTGEPLRIRLTGELATLVERMVARNASSMVRALDRPLVCNERGQRLRQDALRSRFDRARERAIEAHPQWEEPIRNFQFRDLRAKAGTDKAERTDIRKAQKQLGHASVTTTEVYLRKRRGDRVDPTK